MVERADVRTYVTELVAAEKSNPLSDNRSQLELADSWWAVADNARTAGYQRAARKRAVDWYKRVYASIDDPMEQLLIKSRIDVLIEGDDSSLAI
jgi:hypothetical protein